MVKNTSPILAALGKRSRQRDSRRRVSWSSSDGATHRACPRCGDGERLPDDERGRRAEQGLSVALPGLCKTDVHRSHRHDFRGIALAAARVGVRVLESMQRARKASARCSLSREMEITHKSALFVLRRIRHGLGTTKRRRKLTGTVEVDETYIGGKPRDTARRGTGAGLTEQDAGASAWCSVTATCAFG